MKTEEIMKSLREDIFTLIFAIIGMMIAGIVFIGVLGVVIEEILGPILSALLFIVYCMIILTFIGVYISKHKTLNKVYMMQAEADLRDREMTGEE